MREIDDGRWAMRERVRDRDGLPLDRSRSGDMSIGSVFEAVLDGFLHSLEVVNREILEDLLR